jgi:hypothetical protein
LKEKEPKRTLIPPWFFCEQRPSARERGKLFLSENHNFELGPFIFTGGMIN